MENTAAPAAPARRFEVKFDTNEEGSPSPSPSLNPNPSRPAACSRLGRAGQGRAGQGRGEA